MQTNKNKPWDIEHLVLFASWLIKQNEFGYGLLVLHSTMFGIKVGKLVGTTWSVFIDSETDSCYDEPIDFIGLKEKESVKEMNDVTKNLTTGVWKILKAEGGTINDSIYVNRKTQKTLTTSTLKRELERLDDQYRKYLEANAQCILTLDKIATNSFEKAYGRYLVKVYNFSRKVFSELSDYLGHQSLQQTQDFLGYDMIDDINFLFPVELPSAYSKLDLDKVHFTKSSWIRNYIISSGAGTLTT